MSFCTKEYCRQVCSHPTRSLTNDGIRPRSVGPNSGPRYTLRVRLVSRFVDASYDPLVLQICVGVVARGPFSKTQAETCELGVHIADKPGRRKVKDPQTGLLFEKL